MRALISFLIGILTAAAIAAFGLLVMQNAQSAHLNFLGTSLDGASGWMVAGAAVVGFLLAFLLLIPGRLASAIRGWSLSRQSETLERKLATLREQYAQLQGSHERLLAEHQRVVSQVPPPSGTPNDQPPNGQPLNGQPPMPAVLAPSRPLRRTGPIYPPGQHMGQSRQSLGERVKASWERLRTRLRRPSTQEDTPTSDTPADTTREPATPRA
ncbi:MAG: DUF1049 domain-containing protein [Ktedonobacterales bacterium]|nr:DUF1049 domain-containing protein [Ktedonobacterales bacterium]